MRLRQRALEDELIWLIKNNKYFRKPFKKKVFHTIGWTKAKRTTDETNIFKGD